MRKLLILLALICVGTLAAEPPGAATFGTNPERVNGRIVYQPYNSNPRPYYYGGNLVYPTQGAPYRDTGGRIRYETNYQVYPYRDVGYNYNYEMQRQRDQQRYMDQQRQRQQYPQNYQQQPQYPQNYQQQQYPPNYQQPPAGY
jgi:hypothetical protein